MDLTLPTIEGYKSSSQIARVVTEAWGRQHLYCPACTSNSLESTPANTRAVDYVCPNCSHPYQLKSCQRWNSQKVMDAGYNAMIAAIKSNRAPSLFILHNTGRVVQNLVLVPRFFLTESAIEKRPPLAPTARRAGWIGCNILLTHIPEDGRIHIVKNGVVCDTSKVREQFQRVSPFADLTARSRGWTLDVLRVVRTLEKQEFSLTDVYAFEGELAQLYPQNQHVRPKIRQQLQVLRDMGFLEFTTRGRYKLIL